MLKVMRIQRHVSGYIRMKVSLFKKTLGFLKKYGILKKPRVFEKT